MVIYIFALVGWIVVALWHLRRQHQIREKSTILYYFLLLIDGTGFIGDIVANYTWASVILWDMPRLDRREITISQHMARIREERMSGKYGWWTLWVCDKVCNWLNKMDPTGHHC